MKPVRGRGGMRSKILLLAIIPALSVSVILTWYFMSSRQEQLTRDLQILGHSTAEHLAVAGRLALFADDLESLQQIALGPSTNPAVTGVAFLDAYGAPVLASGLHESFSLRAAQQSMAWDDNQFRGETVWYFRAPVRLQAESMTDYEEEVINDEEALLGWALIGLSQVELLAAQRENLIAGGLIFLVAMLVAGLAAWLIGHRIYQPVRDLTATVETMESGDLSVRAQVEGEREVKTLARVINRFAANLGETNLRLQREVDEATAELRQALGAKDEFLARVSHELRTPLTTIIGFTNRLERSPLDSEQHEFTHAIQQSSTLLLAVINDILDFSRLQHGGLELENIEFDLEIALEDVIAMHANAASEKPVELVLLMDSDVPRFCLGDVIRLKQVVNNLLANAVKFTEAGEIIVHASLKNDAAQKSGAAPKSDDDFMLEVSVSDTGIGIERDAMARLFTSFTQADTSINRRFGGSGLGLVICQQLASLLGGEIALRSEVGQGTRAIFSARLERAQVADPGLAIPRREDAVAIVDANRWSRRALRSQLTHWTRQVFALASVQELTDLISTRQPELAAVLISEGAGVVDEQVTEGTLIALRQHYAGPVAVLRYVADTDPAAVTPWREIAQPVTLLMKPTRRQALLQWLDSHVAGEVYLSESDTPASEHQGNLPGIEIIVAEDNTFNQNLFRMILEQEGACVMLAGNGAEAVQRYRESRAQLVLMDAHMPQVDGLAACEVIVREARSADSKVAVIGLTADTSSRELERFLEAGASDVLYKPVDEIVLVKTLCQYAKLPYEHAVNRSTIALASASAALRDEVLMQLAVLCRQLEQDAPAEAGETLHQLRGLCGVYGLLDLGGELERVREALQTRKLARAASVVADLAKSVALDQAGQ